MRKFYFLTGEDLKTELVNYIYKNNLYMTSRIKHNGVFIEKYQYSIDDYIRFTEIYNSVTSFKVFIPETIDTNCITNIYWTDSSNIFEIHMPVIDNENKCIMNGRIDICNKILKDGEFIEQSLEIMDKYNNLLKWIKSKCKNKLKDICCIYYSDDCKELLELGYKLIISREYE